MAYSHGYYEGKLTGVLNRRLLIHIIGRELWTCRWNPEGKAAIKSYRISADLCRSSPGIYRRGSYSTDERLAVRFDRLGMDERGKKPRIRSRIFEACK